MVITTDIEIQANMSWFFRVFDMLGNDMCLFALGQYSTSMGFKFGLNPKKLLVLDWTKH